MAYDRKQDEGCEQVAPPGGSLVDYRLELGRVFVPVGPARTCVVLDPSRAEVVRAWADAVIPRRDERPAASEVGAAEYIDATVFAAPRLRALLLEGVDQVERAARECHGQPFTSCDAATRTGLLRVLEAADGRVGECFAMVQTLTYEAYYAHPRVLAVLRAETGWDSRSAVEGGPLAPFDQGLLARVRALPPRYREV